MKNIFSKLTSICKKIKLRYKILSALVALGVIGYIFTPSLESVVKKIVHKYGSEVVGTDVSISSFKLKLTTGEGSLGGLKVKNPNGYQSDNLLYLKNIAVKVNVSSITKDTIIIDSINVGGPQINYEMVSLTQNNVSDVLNNINKNTASASKEAQKDEGGSKKVIIKKFVVENGKVNVLAGVGKAKKEIPVVLPKIILTNIGANKKGGESVPEVISEVMVKILTSVAGTAKTVGVKALSGLTDSAQNLGKEGVNKAAEQLGKAGNTLGGLFK